VIVKTIGGCPCRFACTGGLAPLLPVKISIIFNTTEKLLGAAGIVPRSQIETDVSYSIYLTRKKPKTLKSLRTRTRVHGGQPEYFFKSPWGLATIAKLPMARVRHFSACSENADQRGEGHSKEQLSRESGCQTVHRLQLEANALPGLYLRTTMRL
jgi:hypothetical protein